MDDIISHGAYTVATYTDEVFSQADRFLNINMIGKEASLPMTLEIMRTT
jgi:hypothetical protein